MLPKEKRDIFMGKLSMELYLKNLSKRYKVSGKREKGLLLQDLCDSSGYHKKHAIRLLNGYSTKKKRKIKTGRPNVYPENILIFYAKIKLQKEV